MERETEKNNELCKNSNLSVPVGQLGNDYYKSYLFKYNLKKTSKDAIPNQQSSTRRNEKSEEECNTTHMQYKVKIAIHGLGNQALNHYLKIDITR